jgi:hypothetical protein
MYFIPPLAFPSFSSDTTMARLIEYDYLSRYELPVINFNEAVDSRLLSMTQQHYSK